MAKAKGSLLSLVTSGSIAKSKIYSSWKGKKTVKSYAKPKYVNTVDQQTQRKYLKDSMLNWKTDGYSIIDVEAWNMFARLNITKLTGMNKFLSEKIKAVKAGRSWTKLTECKILNITTTGCKVEINIAADKRGKLYIGSSNRSMLVEFSGVYSSGKYTFNIINLAQNTKYFFYIKNT